MVLQTTDMGDVGGVTEIADGVDMRDGHGVRCRASGRGKPFAPENWPSEGDVWTWRVGSRHSNSSTFWRDRFLYPPDSFRSLPDCPNFFRSKLPLHRFLLEHFPNMDIHAFFASFLWRIPIHSQSPPPPQPGNHDEEVEIPKQDAKKKNVDSYIRSCNARNANCDRLMSSKKEFLKRIDCNICCTESGFCGACCCILCGKVTDQSSEDFTSIRCEKILDGENICGHVSHLECAFLSHSAGVKSIIGLDVEYYCRRCDNKTDLLLHVERLLYKTQSLKVHAEIENNLMLALRVIEGTQRKGIRTLQTELEAALNKTRSAVDLIDIEELQGIITVIVKGNMETHRQMLKQKNAPIFLGKPATAGQQELLSRRIGLSSLRSSAPKSCSIRNQPCDNVQNRSSHRRAMPTSENQKENHQIESISAPAWNQCNSKNQNPNGHDLEPASRQHRGSSENVIHDEDPNEPLQEGTINDQSHHSWSNHDENGHFEPTSRDTIRNHSHQHSNQHSGPVTTPSSSHSDSIGRGSSSSTQRKEPEIDPVTKKKIILFDVNNKPVGPGSTKLVYDMGQSVRARVSIRYESWDIVPMQLKEKIWSDVNAIYLLPTSYKTKAFSRMGEAYRNAKYQVRKKYDMFDNDVERKRNCPPNIRQEDWKEFVDRESTEVAKERRVKGKHAREQVTTYHVTGRRGAARIGHEMELENPEQPVTRTQLYLASHRRQDGSCATDEEKERVDKIQEIAASNPGSTLLDIDHDPVAQVCGRDKRGNVRGLGCHVNKTQVLSSAPVREHLQKERMKRVSVENKVANMEDTMSEMKGDMTEVISTFTNISQNLSNSIADLRTAFVNIQVPQQFGMRIHVPQQFGATQHRPPMDSFTRQMADPRYMHPTSQMPQTPAAAECECVIKTFGGTAVAKGRAVITYPEATDGTCQFIIDKILDFGAKLYEVDSSASVLGDKPIGSMIRWPKMFVTFTS